MRTHPHTVIIGAGVIGSAAAYFLKRAGAQAVTVIEPDPTYAKAASPVATGGCRRLFARPENIRMSQFSIGFFKEFEKHTGIDPQWKEGGYLFVVTEGHEATLEANYRTEKDLGVNVALLDNQAYAKLNPI